MVDHMKEAFMVFVVLVLVIGFMGCEGVGKAVQLKKGEPLSQQTPEAPILEHNAACKIISPVSSDYQWIWDKNPRASEACKREGMVCSGVFMEKKEYYLDENNRRQGVESENSWLSNYYCNEKLGDQRSNIIENSHENYVEPYAGSVKTTEFASAVLCCKI